MSQSRHRAELDALFGERRQESESAHQFPEESRSLWPRIRRLGAELPTESETALSNRPRNETGW